MSASMLWITLLFLFCFYYAGILASQSELNKILYLQHRFNFDLEVINYGCKRVTLAIIDPLP